MRYVIMSCVLILPQRWEIWEVRNTRIYWCGIREGELLALTAADFDFEKETVRINKSYQRLYGEDVITTPKTKKSNRMIKMPKFLCEEIQEYLNLDVYKRQHESYF